MDDVEMTDGDMAAAQAAEALTASLDEWTSQKLGSPMVISRASHLMTDHYRNADDGEIEEGYSYEPDPQAWLQGNDDDTGNDDDVTDQLLPMHATTTTPRRNLDRADTPVMSNTKRTTTTANSSGKSPAFNVQSPYISQTPAVIRRSQHTLKTTNTSNSAHSGTRHHHPHYRRYHDAVVTLLRHKRRILDQAQLTTSASTSSTESESAALVVNNSKADAERWTALEQKMDVEFLGQLSRTCYEYNNSTSTTTTTTNKEGNFWSLLEFLRKLGVAALVWDDDPASRAQNKAAAASYVQTLSLRHTATPRALLKELHYSKTSPLALRRRHCILQWLHACFAMQQQQEGAISSSSRATRVRQTQPDLAQTHLLQQGLYATDKDAELLSASLALILAGRLADAQTLCRDSGASWRAAAWGGGAPLGHDKATKKSTGNPRRALWRRMVYKHADALHQNPAASPHETAILALLGSHCKAALDCSALRTFEKGLVSTFTCTASRTEDELLFRQQQQFQNSLHNPPVPGLELYGKFQEHLQETADIAGMDETDMLQVLESTPFDEMKSSDMVTQATSAFLQGKNCIFGYMDRSQDQLDVTVTNHGSSRDDIDLRFLVHVAIYLDTLSFGATTSLVLEGVADYKNDLLVRYVRHLSARDDLWYMVVLYASMLPISVILDELPRLLQCRQSQDERKVVVEQLGEFLTVRQDLDLDVLRAVVTLVLSESEDEEDLGRHAAVPTDGDVRKMKSILWLCFKDEHAGDALMFANALLRQFLWAEDKIVSAVVFVEDVLPGNFLDEAVAKAQTFLGASSDHFYETRIQHAHSEHLAYTSFLEATKAVDQWTRTICAVEATVPEESLAASGGDDSIDRSKLNAAEAAIAIGMDRRKLVELKRKASLRVVGAADKARKALLSVLEHPGGWLLTDDEALAGGDIAEVTRRKELLELRSMILPRVVTLYHDICINTASWMSESLDDAVEQLGPNVCQNDALLQIDVSSSSTSVDKHTIVSSSSISPRYWTRKALELCEITQTDTFGIRLAFHAAEYKDLALRLAEATIAHEMYDDDKE